MKNIIFWFRLCVLNFVIVSILGVLMRYKIVYSLPFLNQKYIQDAHSHFAFYGWITQLLYVFITNYLKQISSSIKIRKYQLLLILNVFVSYGMLILFLLKGYFLGSVLTSILSICIGFCFLFFVYKDLSSFKNTSKNWIISGLFFSGLSSLGIFSLSYSMMSGNVNQNIYLISNYFYLHFQYNGFFIFTCIGLFIHTLQSKENSVPFSTNTSAFWMLFLSCFLGFGLSILWLDLVFWMLILVFSGSILQIISSYQLLSWVRKNWKILKDSFHPLYRYAIVYVGFAFIVKILLQFISNIPEISQFAFGFRNVVIAYLHLVLLMCISVFLIAQTVLTGFFKLNKLLKVGFISLLLFILLNEFFLGIIGIFSIFYIPIPQSAEVLLILATLLSLSTVLLFISLRKVDV